MLKDFKGLAEYYQENSINDETLKNQIIEKIKTEISGIDQASFIQKAKMWPQLIFRWHFC